MVVKSSHDPSLLQDVAKAFFQNSFAHGEQQNVTYIACNCNILLSYTLSRKPPFILVQHIHSDLRGLSPETLLLRD